ncbi:MAG: hypothetical protein ABI665_21960 [Vicinamibacterales bacterium]
MALPCRSHWGIVLLLSVAAHLGSAATAHAQLGALVSPGRLHKAHAAIEGVGNCLQCHSKGQQVAADKCLACHKPIAERIAARKGIHRNVTGDCVTCHVEHAGADAELRPFDQARFNHTRDTAFPLDGLHAPLAANCAACHKTRSYLTAPTTCAACHADPHKGTLGTQCATCHATAVKFATAVKGFDHSRTAFALAGAHGKVACESCHKNKQYKGIAFASCSSCHTDPHRSKLGATCTQCHTEAAWRTTKVDHARTAFPLRGKHATVECAKCHVKPSTAVKLRSDTCAACHTDPHRGEFKQDCSACHTELTFQKGTFDHATTKFLLADKHAGLACVACHKAVKPAANDFRGLKTTCDSCHADVHRGELGLQCEKCHTARSFDVKTFTHTNPRPFFAGRHAPLTCAQCHAGTMQPTRTAANVPALRVGFATTGTTCVSCHKDVHLGQLASTCETCHSLETPKFGGVVFSHAGTKFPLTGKHAPLVCEKCHAVETGAFPSGPGTARRFTGVSTQCAACHQDPHRGQLDQACQSCHSTDTFALPRYTHQNARGLREFFVGRHAAATCAACHKPLPGTPAGAKPVAAYKVSTTCTSCHTDVHRGALGSACETCHKP